MSQMQGDWSMENWKTAMKNLPEKGGDRRIFLMQTKLL
jgi:hypothetical protein